MKLTLVGPSHRVARLNQSLNTYDWDFRVQTSSNESPTINSLETQASDLNNPECGGFKRLTQSPYCINTNCAVSHYCPASEEFGK